MKFILQTVIKVYWFCWSKGWERTCLFRESCSRYVYRSTEEKGFKAGVEAFVKRYRKCRGDYSLFIHNGHIQLRLRDDSILREHEISKEVLTSFRQSMNGSKHRILKQIAVKPTKSI